jgi:hypothetical protein
LSSIDHRVIFRYLSAILKTRWHCLLRIASELAQRVNSSVDHPAAIGAVSDVLAAIDHAELGSTMDFLKLANDAVSFSTSSGAGTFPVIAANDPGMIGILRHRARLPNGLMGLHRKDSL